MIIPLHWTSSGLLTVPGANLSINMYYGESVAIAEASSIAIGESNSVAMAEADSVAVAEADSTAMAEADPDLITAIPEGD